jgi:hypothetical protein
MNSTKKLLSLFQFVGTRFYGNEPEGAAATTETPVENATNNSVPDWIAEVKGEQKVEAPATEQAATEEKSIDFKSRFGFDETEIEQRVKGYDELKADLEKVVNSNPYKSNYAEQLDNLLSKGVDLTAAINYLTTDVDKMDGLDLLVTDMVIQNPSLKGKEEALKEELAEKFKQGEWADGAKVMDTLEFEKAVAEAKERQKKYLEDSITPKRADIIAEKEAAKNKQEWEKEFPNIVPKSLKFEIEGKQINFEIKDPKLEVQLNNIIQSLGGVTKENVETAKEYIENELLVANKQAIFKLIYEQGATSKVKETFNELENVDTKSKQSITSTLPEWTR